MPEPSRKPVPAWLDSTVRAAVFLTVGGVLVLVASLAFTVEPIVIFTLVVMGMCADFEEGRGNALRRLGGSVARMPLAFVGGGLGAGSLALFPPPGRCCSG